MKYEVIGTPHVETEYSDQWETVMTVTLRRLVDGAIGTGVWIVAGVMDYNRAQSKAAGTQVGYLTVRPFGNSPDAWCPDGFDSDEMGDIISDCFSAAIRMHGRRMLSLENDPG